MSVSLHPPTQLGFPRPLTQLVKRSLSVTNSNSQPVAFKVKTTAPKQYCVRPNSGRIEPGETVEVQVLLQPMKEDPAAGTKCRDKFLVQSVIITPEREGTTLPELWSVVEKEDKSGLHTPALIHEQKIRCSYLPPEDAPDRQPTAIVNGNGAQPKPTVSSLDPIAKDESNYDTIRPTNGNGREIPSADSAFSQPPDRNSSIPSTTPSTSTSTISQKNGIKDDVLPSSPASSSLLNTSSSGSSNANANSNAEEVTSLKSELSAAKAEIARLKSQLEQAETTAATLRSRGAAIPVSSGGAVPGTAQAVVEQKGQDGVPLQVVAGIAFGVFVFTWIFF